ncbi:MAG TPA: hypothetical protein VFN49_01150 [Candidatus Aquilonibacter sp.]|nr:hypothetical protein [Candidatus Aquilonibacter sp.]
MKRWLIPAIIVVGAFLVTVLVMQSARGVCENTRRREQSIALTQTFFRSVRNGESRTNIEARAAALGLESRGDEPTISYHALVLAAGVRRHVLRADHLSRGTRAAHFRSAAIHGPVHLIRKQNALVVGY